MDKALEGRLRASQLASLPGVALRIISFASDPDPEPEDVIAAIALDPALTAKILRAANSALYNSRGRVRNLSQALMLMGAKGVLNIALSFTFLGFVSGHAASSGHALFWRRSVLAALAARETALRVALSAVEEVFTAALLQDIGILALDSAVPADYRHAVDGAANHAARCAAEQRAFGCDHAAVGAWLIAHWGFPEALVDAVRLSHDPGDGVESKRIVVRCVAVSGLIADICLEADAEAAMQRAWAAFDRWLGHETEVLGAVLEAVRRKLDEVGPLFELGAFDTTRLDEIVEQARRLIAIRTAVEVASAHAAADAEPPPEPD